MGSSIFPLAMKVASKTIGQDLVSVQPMSQPSGNFFFDHKQDEYWERKKLVERRQRILEDILGEDE